MKKKILTLFLAFTIMMTFMPSMAFAETLKTVNANFILQESEEGLICDLLASDGLDTTFQCQFYDSDNNIVCLFDAENGVSDGQWWVDGEEEYQILDKSDALQLFDRMDHVVVAGTIAPPEQGFEPSGTVVEAYFNGDRYDNIRTDYSMPVTEPTSEYPIIAMYNEGEINLMVYYDIPHGKPLLEKVLKGVAIAAGVVAVVGVVGTAVKNAQKAAVAQQMAFKAQMQQKMVQKQAAAIKTVLKGAAVVVSLASFGSSLRNLYGLNNFGFNQFGFNPFGFR